MPPFLVTLMRATVSLQVLRLLVSFHLDFLTARYCRSAYFGPHLYLSLIHI